MDSNKQENITRTINGVPLPWVSSQVQDMLRSAPEITEKSLGNYTKPDLRERLKRQIMAGSDGGRPGQWSARKAQLLAARYRKAGGGYRGGKSKSQRSLSKWTREKWTTIDGKPAKRKGGMYRYLPAKAWARLTPAQRRATNAKKFKASKTGRQFVANTAKAREAGSKIRNMDKRSDG